MVSGERRPREVGSAAGECGAVEEHAPRAFSIARRGGQAGRSPRRAAQRCLTGRRGARDLAASELRQFAKVLPTTRAILMHWAMAPATLYIWDLGPESRNFKISPMRRANFKIFAFPSSTQRVLQLWSSRTWSTWLLFWSRKWPSEASNHDFFPLRGLGEGCALWGARKQDCVPTHVHPSTLQQLTL